MLVRELQAEFRVALTGTPIENRLAELWSILDFLNPGLLGTHAKFQRLYGIPIERNNDESAMERLRNLVSPFILRRVKSDPKIIQDLPDKMEHKIYCTLTREQATLYQALVDAEMGKNGVNVYSRRGMSSDEYFANVRKVLNYKPNVIIDDGADLVATVHTEMQDLIPNILGSSEETTSGVKRLKAMAAQGVLKFPVIDVNDALSK